MALDLAGYVRKETTVSLGGQEFVFSELTVSDLAEFRAWMLERREANREKRKEQIMADAKNIEGIDPMKLLEKLDAPPTEEEIDAEMNTVEGVGRLAFLSLKHSHAYERLQPGEIDKIIGINDIEKITAAMFPLTEAQKKAEGKKKAKSAKP